MYSYNFTFKGLKEGIVDPYALKNRTPELQLNITGESANTRQLSNDFEQHISSGGEELLKALETAFPYDPVYVMRACAEFSHFCRHSNAKLPYALIERFFLYLQHDMSDQRKEIIEMCHHHVLNRDFHVARKEEINIKLLEILSGLYLKESQRDPEWVCKTLKENITHFAYYFPGDANRMMRLFYNRAPASQLPLALAIKKDNPALAKAILLSIIEGFFLNKALPADSEPDYEVTTQNLYDLSLQFPEQHIIYTKLVESATENLRGRSDALERLHSLILQAKEFTPATEIGLSHAEAIRALAFYAPINSELSIKGLEEFQNIFDVPNYFEDRFIVKDFDNDRIPSFLLRTCYYIIEHASLSHNVNSARNTEHPLYKKAYNIYWTTITKSLGQHLPIALHWLGAGIRYKIDAIAESASKHYIHAFKNYLATDFKEATHSLGCIASSLAYPQSLSHCQSTYENTIRLVEEYDKQEADRIKQKTIPRHHLM